MNVAASEATTAIPKTNTEARSVRSEYVPLAIISVLFIAIYWTTFGFMMNRWNVDPSFQHGWLVIPVALWVAWAKRDTLKATPLSSHKGGLWIMALALLMHMFEKAIDLNGPSPVSIPIFIAGAVLYFAGPAMLRELAFPIAYLVFMIPIPGGLTEVVSFPLRLMATTLSKVVAGWFGVQTFGAGMNLDFGQPHGSEWIQLEVADPCSGLHSIMAIKALHAIFAYTTRLKIGWKWFLFWCALPIALLSNLVRIVGVILVGAYWSKDIAVGLFHTAAPFILYPIALAILISIGRLLEWLTVPRTTSPSS